jgi:hypothetical protein
MGLARPELHGIFRKRLYGPLRFAATSEVVVPPAEPLVLTLWLAFEPFEVKRNRSTAG